MLFCDLCIFKYSSSVFLYVCMCLYWKIENVYKSLYLFCGYMFCLCYFCMYWYIFWIHWCKCIFWKNTCKIAVASCICTYSLYNRHKNMHNLTWSYIYINASLCMYRTYCIIFVYTKHTSHVGDLSWNLSIIGSFRPYMQILFFCIVVCIAICNQSVFAHIIIPFIPKANAIHAKTYCYVLAYTDNTCQYASSVLAYIVVCIQFLFAKYQDNTWKCILVLVCVCINTYLL